MLTHVAEHGVEPPPSVRVTRSHPFEAMYFRDRRVQHGGASLPLADIGAYAALHLPDFGETNEHALHAGPGRRARRDAQGGAGRGMRWPTNWSGSGPTAGCAPTTELGQPGGANNDLNDDDFGRLIHRLATRRALRDWYISRKYLERTTEEVLDELRVRGRYPAVAERRGQPAEHAGRRASGLHLPRRRRRSARPDPRPGPRNRLAANGRAGRVGVRERIQGRLRRPVRAGPGEAGPGGDGRGHGGADYRAAAQD